MPWGLNADAVRVKDPPLDKPKRPCAGCGRRFQPTVKRRMLCTECYRRGEAPMHADGLEGASARTPARKRRET